MNTTIKTNKSPNSYDISMKGFTAGMVLAMQTALQNHPTAVAMDCLAFLNEGIRNNAKLAEVLK